MVEPDDRYIYQMKSTDISMLIIIHFVILLEILIFSVLRVGSCFLKRMMNSPMLRPEYIQLQNVALLLQKCVKISSEYFVMLYPKVSQVKWFNFLYIPHHPSTYLRLPTCFFCYLGCS